MPDTIYHDRRCSKMKLHTITWCPGEDMMVDGSGSGSGYYMYDEEYRSSEDEAPEPEG